MGWFFRKSKSFGPFRLNFSKSGVGFSFGVKGARLSVNSRGTYVNLGSSGIYYRQRVDKGGRRPRGRGPVPYTPTPTELTHSITTEDVEQVTDVGSEAFIDELETKHKRVSFFRWLGLMPSLLVLSLYIAALLDLEAFPGQRKKMFTIERDVVNVHSGPSVHDRIVATARYGESYEVSGSSDDWVKIIYQIGPSKTAYVRRDLGSISELVIGQSGHAHTSPHFANGLLVTTVSLLAWCFMLYRVDMHRKGLNVFYTFDEKTRALHERFTDSFREFTASGKVWQKLHEQGVKDAKYHAGASQLVNRVVVRVLRSHRLPSRFIKTNVHVPFIGLRNTELYFFPERLILKRGNRFGGCFYKNLRVSGEDTQFIEKGAVPRDAFIAYYTWKYTNKRGGPDGRFGHNPRIPVCIYTDYTFESDTGIHEVITTSGKGAMDAFCNAVSEVAEMEKSLKRFEEK